MKETVQETTSSHSTTYALDSITGTVPSAKLWARIYLIVPSGVTASTNVYFDDVTFRKLIKEIYDGTAERNIGTAENNIPLVDAAATITDGKLPLNLSEIIGTAVNGELVLKLNGKRRTRFETERKVDKRWFGWKIVYRKPACHEIKYYWDGSRKSDRNINIG